jgi:hypothetical protein
MDLRKPVESNDHSEWPTIPESAKTREERFIVAVFKVCLVTMLIALAVGVAGAVVMGLIALFRII